MTPASYYCWLYRTRGLWWLTLRKDPPAPEQNCPWSAVLVGATLVGVVATLLLGAVNLILQGGGAGWAPLQMYAYAGGAGVAMGLSHYGFLWFVWSRRAALLRAGAMDSRSVDERPGRVSRALLGPIYVLSVAVLTPLGVSIAVENIRGAWAWKAVRTELMGRRERLTYREFFPGTVAAESNFASHPMFANLFKQPEETLSEPAGRRSKIDTNAMNRFAVFSLPEMALTKLRSKRGGAGATGNRSSLSGATLAEWAETFRVAISNQTASAGRGNAAWVWQGLPRYAEAPPNASDALTVLTALSGAQADLQSICAVTDRPRSRFDLKIDDGPAMLLPHVAQLKKLNSLLRLQVMCKLELGETNGAFQDALCSLRLAEALREEPLLISQMVRLSQRTLANQAVSLGIQRHRWTEPQLKQFQEHFEKLRVLSDFANALDGERAMMMMMMDRWVGDRKRFLVELDGLGLASEDLPLSVSVGLIRTLILPRGWVRQNQAALAMMLQDRIELARSWEARLANQSGVDLLEEFARAESRAFGAISRLSSYNIFVKQLLPSTRSAMGKAMRGEAMTRMGATACALERYYLAHQKYPERLEQLTPQFLARAPVDPMSGKSFVYLRTEDGAFELSSTGLAGVAARRGAEAMGQPGQPEDGRESQGELKNWAWPEGASEWVWPN